MIEIAKLLTSIKADEERALEAKHTALWLIQHLPEAQADWEAMNRKPEERPSKMDLAKFVFAVASQGNSRSPRGRLAG